MSCAGALPPAPAGVEKSAHEASIESSTVVFKGLLRGCARSFL
jgi:hypothetical protein